MKLKIGDFEVNVTASTKYRKRETTYFLNSLSIALDEAAKQRKEKDQCYEVFEEMSNDIYKYLKNKGVYDKYN
jgi:hypothetical protein